MLAKPQNKPGIVFLLLVLRPGPSASEKVFLSNHKLPASALQAARTAQPLMLMVPKRELASLTELALPLNPEWAIEIPLRLQLVAKTCVFPLA